MFKFKNENRITDPKVYLEHTDQSFSSPKSIILCYSNRVFNEYLSDSSKWSLLGYKRGKLLINKSCKVGILGLFGIGSSTLSLCIEELSSLGATNFIIIGFAGSIDPNISIGEVCEIGSAFIDEGTSMHYNQNYNTVVNNVSPAINSTLLDHEIKMVRSWSIDAPYRETITKREQALNNKCSIVDMESSALICISTFLGLNSSSFLVITDYLGEEKKWQLDQGSVDIKNKFHKFLKSIIEVATSRD
jgi:uridine phosphorylase